MPIEKLGELIEEQTSQVDLPESLLEGEGDVSDDLDNFGYEGFIWGDLVVPVLHKFPQDDGDEGVELQVDIIPTGKWRQKFLY